MKKLVLLTLLIMVFSLGAFAQDEAGKGIIAKGFKAGLVMANLSSDNISENDMKLGFAGGAFITYAFSPQFAIQPEVMYCMKGTKFSMEGAEDDLKYNFDYLVVPIMLKYMIPTEGNVAPNFFAGPEVGFLLSAKAKMGGEEADMKDELKSVDFGLGFGAGVDFKMESTTIMFDARYTLGLSNIADDTEGGDFSVKNTALMFTLGIGF